MKSTTSKLRYLRLLPMLACMVIIFLFSARDGVVSQNDSYRVGQFVCKLTIPHYTEQSKAEQLALAARIDYPVRKCAHATEYAILGLTIYLALSLLTLSRLQHALVTIELGALYAATDEFHQFFVPGRSCQSRDVLIDTIGCAVAIGLLSLILWMVKKQKTSTNGAA